ncbi:respiratory nitrate reductase subunit gamma [Candidatus Obscuribacterales bacterium]|nr:respiratory nitrate reductase subunit gamma [Candidatus Obscuribacterales bacterium]
MIDNLLFVVLPYLALFTCVFGSIYRMRKHPMTYSSLSSQFLEGKGLVWGSLPWHIGIILILVAHVVAFLVPGLWQSLMSHQAVLMVVESIGLGLSLLCLVGLVILAVRRLTSSKLQAVTSTMDLVVILLVLLQVGLGAAIAVHCKWGSSWCSGTTTPYLWSIFSLQPDVKYIVDLPLVVKAHIVAAWAFLIAIPFSRLIHMFAVPIEYLFRPPQNVVWTNPRKLQSEDQPFAADEARRDFVRAFAGILVGGLLLSVGTFDKVFSFFFGPRLGRKEETEFMELKMERLQATVDQRKLELERHAANYILVGSLSDLDAETGKYFIDYNMQPAIAFKGKDGMPLLISAKCTHLGCTVGNKVDENGKILCPCHVSYFDIQTGAPNDGAPAKEPLPHLGWVIMDERGKVLSSRDQKGDIQGAVPPECQATARVYIAKGQEETT